MGQTQTQFESATELALRKIKNNSSIVVQGRNPKIDTYYQVWSGSPNWLNFKVHFPDGETRDEKYKTLNVARYICRTWANNYANEDTIITIPKESANNRLQAIFADNNFFGKFNNFVESFMGLGIGATVIGASSYMVDEEGNGIPSDSEVKIQIVGGRRVIPITIVDGEVTECAFVSFHTGGAKLVIHYLNEREEYSIAELKATGQNGNYTFDYGNITILDTKSKIPLFQIWHPNITDEDDIDNECGTAITDKAFDTFFQCDVCYTAFFKEIKLGQKVKFISADLGVVNADGKLEVPYDVNDESVISVPSNTDASPLMQEFNGDLRVQAIVQALNFHLNAAAMLCGLGQSQFEFDGTGGRPIQTATGVIAKQTELYRNVIKQENFATTQFRKMVQAIAYVNDNFTNQEKIDLGKINDIQVTYDDNIVEDTDSKKKQELSEVQAGVMSIAEYRANWYDEDLESAIKFLQENAMLINTYLAALQAGAMTPEKFVDLVYGPGVEGREELITYITEHMNQMSLSDVGDYEDEGEDKIPEEKEKGSDS